MTSSSQRPFGAAFLRTPDLFPVRLGGEPWSDRVDRIDFAGGPYLVAGLTAAQAAALGERFGPLLRPLDTQALPRRGPRALPPPGAPQGSLPVEIGVYRAAADEFLGVPPEPGWTYTFDRDYQPESVRLAGLDWMGHLRFDAPGLRGALFTPDDGGPAFPCLFENFFRTLVAYRLLECGGVLFHSAGIASGGVAHLFLGRSGAGKSTLSRLSRATGRIVLSDDMNALVPDTPSDRDTVAAPSSAGATHGTFRVERLPFAGDLGRTPGARQRFPLGHLCRLQQGPTALEPLRGARAVAHLFACAPFVNADPHRVEALGSVLEALIARHPMVDLHVSLDEDCWRWLDGTPAPPTPWPSAALDEVLRLRQANSPRPAGATLPAEDTQPSE